MDENVPTVQEVNPAPVSQPQASQPPPSPEPILPMEPKPDKSQFLAKLALVFLVLALLGLVGSLIKGFVASRKEEVACTLEAKVCPDGTSVGRVAPSCEFAPCPSPTSTPDLTADWKTYTDSKYGFQIKYPDSYKIVSDNYGWPKAIFMLYKGGQSYDLVIEVWEKESDYKSKYQNLQMTLVDKEVGNEFMTLLNMNKDPEVDQIISTFKFVGSPESKGRTYCGAERPEVCTLECIDPPPFLCGSNGKSYCSACQACSDQDVEWYELRNDSCRK